MRGNSALSLLTLTALTGLIVCPMGSKSANAQATKKPAPILPGLQTGAKLTRPAQFAPNIYTLRANPGGRLQISGSDYVLDLAGVVIDGGDRKGIGIQITNARNVTIKNATVRGCLWGIVIEKSEGVKLIDCDASDNANLTPGTVIDESGKDPEDQWGGGILLRDSKNGTVQSCKAMRQWDGIDVVRSEGNVIADSDFSYNNNWGVHFWASSHNTFRYNKATWCTTGGGALYQALTGWQTYDAQAVAIDHASKENLIEGNDLRFGGDGIFIRANEGGENPANPVPPKNSSDGNILRNNDCSFSPNNAIEVDFVQNTVIEGNNCSNSNYGMWLGYSRNSIVRDNLVINCTRHAVEIENGQDGVFERNVFGFDTPRPDGQLVYLRQNGRDKTRSGGYAFRDNLFYGANRGVLLKATDAQFERNLLTPVTQAQGQLVKGDTASSLKETGTVLRPYERPANLHYIVSAPKKLSAKPGMLLSLNITRPNDLLTPPLLELEGIPLWVRSFKGTRVTVQLPADFWDRPAQSVPTLSVFDGSTLVESIALQLLWDPTKPRIDAVSPNPADFNDSIKVVGDNLDGGHILFNGQPVETVETTNTRIVLKPMNKLTKAMKGNFVWVSGTGTKTEQTPPIVVSVEMPKPPVRPAK